MPSTCNKRMPTCRGDNINRYAQVGSRAMTGVEYGHGRWPSSLQKRR